MIWLRTFYPGENYTAIACDVCGDERGDFRKIGKGDITPDEMRAFRAAHVASCGVD